ncbi:SGNH/GDSL hydrolase family protein [Pedobacter endophyticus]|uniref:GDSL-like Lipase/Acylhydrolase family protein n=1 Tax=Pedobacter endophyticus TaxID=2789740 RepID=A0A7S9L137_9SPHI|nr:hypothetical protein [Pedobacter endophyticus]QPH40560.1 hypothetical protein IZT61_04575 [Pedobacter endophyticus]
MKTTLTILFFIVLSLSGFSQVVLPSYPASAFPTYYWQQKSEFELLPGYKNPVLFIGDSLTDGGEWPALFGDANLLNFGISGETTAGIINRLPEIAKRRPQKNIFDDWHKRSCKGPLCR